MLQTNKRISIKEESFGVLSGIEIFISNKWYTKHYEDSKTYKFFVISSKTISTYL